MSKHPNTVQGKTAKELAKEFARTTYGFQERFFEECTILYKKEAKNDKERGYTRLAEALLMLSVKVEHAQHILNHIWKICKPRMEKSYKVCPECKGDKDYHFLGQMCCPKCYSKGQTEAVDEEIYK